MKKNHLLRIAREERDWTIKYCARKIGINTKSYRLWEVGEHEPTILYLRQLCKLFACGPEELGYRIYQPTPEESAPAVVAPDFGDLTQPDEVVFDPGEPETVIGDPGDLGEAPMGDPDMEYYKLHPWKNALLMVARKRRGWTQLELSKRIGANYMSCSQWENNRALPSLANLFALCQAFNCTAAELGYPIEPPTHPSSSASKEEPPL